MLFIPSKLFWLIVQPGNLLVLLLLLGTLLLLFSARRRGLGLIVFTACGFLAIILLPLGGWSLTPLENRFPQPQPMPAHVDGIILLGGAVDTAISGHHGQVALGEAAARVTSTVALSRQYPQVPIVISGGNVELAGGKVAEATLTGQLLVQLGVDRGRLVLEKRSRTTYENAVDSRALVKPQPGQVWLLVTTAAHMPRAVGCFRAVGWGVVPYPVDYRTGRGWSPDRFDLAENLDQLDFALHEWIGLAAYRLLGRTDTLFPAPQPGAPEISSSSPR